MRLGLHIPGFLALIALGSGCSHSSRLEEETRSGNCPKSWVYFDLGETLISSKIDPGHFRFMRIRNGKPTPDPLAPISARQMLEDLRKRGYHMGLITNIPASWGKDEESKIAALKLAVDKDWTDTEQFDWSWFDLGILVPKDDFERKPAPGLFLRAIRAARRAGCEAVYQGEDLKEVQMALQVGMDSYQVGLKPSFFKDL